MRRILVVTTLVVLLMAGFVLASASVTPMGEAMTGPRPRP